MLVFQELEIEAEDQDAVADLLQELTKEAWERNIEAEKKLREVGSTQLAFRYTGAHLPTASLFLSKKNKRHVVTNVVPEMLKELKKSEYNALLGDFYQRVSQSKQLRAHISRSEQSIEDMFSEDAAKALRRFSSLANMSTSNHHPNDRGRWSEFIYKAARDNADVDASILHELLTELGWDEDTADRLSRDYESSLAAVKYALEQEKCA